MVPRFFGVLRGVACHFAVLLGFRRPGEEGGCLKFVCSCLALLGASCLAAPPTGGASAPPILFSPAASVPVKASCDCTSYPFKPNPPCFGVCVERFAESKNPDLQAVKGLDPGV